MTSDYQVLGLNESTSSVDLRTALSSKVSELLLTTDIFTDPDTKELFISYLDSYTRMLSKTGEEDTDESLRDYPPYIIENLKLSVAIYMSLKEDHSGSLEKSLTLDSKFSLHKGVIKLRAGHLKEAYQDFLSCIRSEPDNPDVWVWQGELCLKENNERKAAYMFETALRLSPENRELKNRVQKLMDSVNNIDSEPFFRRALLKLRNYFRI